MTHRWITAWALALSVIGPAAAQTAAPRPPATASAPAELFVPSAVKAIERPAGDLPITRWAQELASANASMQAELARLRALATQPVPPDCDRRVLNVGLLAGGFTLRPGQSVVVGGCFGKAPPGEVRMNGSFTNGHVTLELIEWGATFVHARVPDLTGVRDLDDVRVQLRFGDGDFSNEIGGRFRARRVVYETSTYFDSFVALDPMGHAVCSWMVPTPCASMPATAAPDRRRTAWFVAATPTSGRYALRGRNPQHHLHAVYASSFAGQLAVGGWGPQGELLLDWTTAAKSPWGQVSWVRFERVVFDAPVGLAPGATPVQSPLTPLQGLPR